MKCLRISDSSFEVLRRWASVGRTIDAAVNAIFDGELAQELLDLKDALDDCGRAAKREEVTW